jgi:hypothetical protein
MFIRYAKFMFAPDTGVSTGETTSTDQQQVDNNVEIDYKALYEQEKEARAQTDKEKQKLKEAFDKKASALAAKEKAERENMSAEQKRELEIAEKDRLFKEMANQLNTIKVESVFSKQGYDEKDYTDLSKSLVEIGGDKANDLAEAIVEFVKKANKTAIANAKNSMIKDSAITPKASTTTTTEEHIYATMATESNTPSNNINEIKDFYRKR